MACPADQEYVLAVCLEHISQASLNLILQWDKYSEYTSGFAMSLRDVQKMALQRNKGSQGSKSVLP